MRTIGITAVVALLVACGVADRAGEVVVEDGTGREVRLASPAERVISLIPSVTDVVVAMGAADRLVARTEYDVAASVAHLPSLGGGLTPSLEWLAAREPELVVAWPDARSRSVVSRLEALGIAAYAAPSQRVADALEVTRDLGTLLGMEAAADSLVGYIRGGLEAVAGSVDGLAVPGVLYVIGFDPLMAAGPGTFVDELIRVAGGRNVLAELDVLWPQLALEEVLARDPDVIVVGKAPLEAGLLERLRGAPGWRDLTAVRAGRVYQVDANRFNRPGPGMVAAARRLADLFHPSPRSGESGGGGSARGPGRRLR